MYIPVFINDDRRSLYHVTISHMTKQVYECSMKFVISEALSALCIVQPIIYIIKS